MLRTLKDDLLQGLVEAEETVSAVLKSVLVENAILCTDVATVYRTLARSEEIEHHTVILIVAKVITHVPSPEGEG